MPNFGSSLVAQGGIGSLRQHRSWVTGQQEAGFDPRLSPAVQEALQWRPLQHRMADILSASEQARSRAMVAAVKVQSAEAAERRRWRVRRQVPGGVLSTRAAYRKQSLRQWLRVSSLFWARVRPSLAAVVQSRAFTATLSVGNSLGMPMPTL